jgi:hypothetical protein
VDSWKILEMLLRKNLSLIPDQWYKTPKALFFNEVNDDLKELMHKKRRVFIWGKEFSLFQPLFVLQNSGPRQGEYSIGAEYGGPFLDLTLPACFERNGKINLSCGTFTYPEKFKNPEKDKWLKAPEELIKAYKVTCDDFKKTLKRFKYKKYIWIGEDALNLLRTDEAKIVDKGA